MKGDKMKAYYLIPDNGQKSFYGKAKVIEYTDGSKTLISYTTPVAKIDRNGNVSRLWPGWSATTGKHIRSFCGLNKAAFMALPCNTTPADKAAAYSGTLYR